MQARLSHVRKPLHHCLHCIFQEPPEPQDPPEELLEPTYFTEPKLLGLELHNLEAANAAATQRMQVIWHPA